MSTAPADTLADEQRHLDRTWEAYEAVLRELAGERTSGIDEWAAEALERMRRERLRLYTESSGPLYFGRIDEEDGRVLHIGRHAIADRHNELLAINWRAPAAQPFYTATPAERHGVLRRRRLEIEERSVRGYVDETLATGEGDEALTDAIVEDITRRRVGEMRQIISTITPEQYELIAESVEGPLVIQGGPGTGKTAVGLHRAAWLLYADPALHRSGVLVVGPNEVFIAYISQVLPSLGETSVEQRAAESLAPARGLRIAEPTDVATLKGSGRMATLLERLLWDRVGAPAEPVELVADRVAVVVGPDDVQPLIDAARQRFRSHRAGRERFRAQLASRLATRVQEGRRASFGAGHEELETLVRKTSSTTPWGRSSPASTRAIPSGSPRAGPCPKCTALEERAWQPHPRRPRRAKGRPPEAPCSPSARAWKSCPGSSPGRSATSVPASLCHKVVRTTSGFRVETSAGPVGSASGWCSPCRPTPRPACSKRPRPERAGSSPRSPTPRSPSSPWASGAKTWVILWTASDSWHRARRACNILGCLFPSEIFPGRAPAGHVALAAFAGGRTNPEIVGWDDERLASTLLSELRGPLGLRASPPSDSSAAGRGPSPSTRWATAASSSGRRRSNRPPRPAPGRQLLRRCLRAGLHPERDGVGREYARLMGHNFLHEQQPHVPPRRRARGGKPRPRSH